MGPRQYLWTLDYLSSGSAEVLLMSWWDPDEILLVSARPSHFQDFQTSVMDKRGISITFLAERTTCSEQTKASTGWWGLPLFFGSAATHHPAAHFPPVPATKQLHLCCPPDPRCPFSRGRSRSHRCFATNVLTHRSAGTVQPSWSQSLDPLEHSDKPKDDGIRCLDVPCDYN